MAKTTQNIQSNANSDVQATLSIDAIKDSSILIPAISVQNENTNHI